MEIDRTKTCPFLLRCFWKMHRHHSLGEYRNVAQDIHPSQEVQIYTWQNATLREICDLLKDVVHSARDKNSHLSLNLIYVDPKDGRFASRQIGYLSSSKEGPDDSKTLSSCKIEIGDFLDIAVITSSTTGGAPRNVNTPRGIEGPATADNNNNRDRERDRNDRGGAKFNFNHGRRFQKS